MDGQHDRLRRARIEAGYESAVAAAEARGWNRNTYGSNENGNASFSYRKAKDYAEAFGVRPEWLYDGQGAMRLRDGPALVQVIGRVGANAEGNVIFTTGQQTGDMAPIPPGGTPHARALEVSGHSMRGLADEGALLYFEDQRTPPTPDMIGYVVVLETTEGEVLVKRLLKGSAAGLYDLESLAGPRLEDRQIVWAAHITAIIPPRQARRILIRSGEAAA